MSTKSLPTFDYHYKSSSLSSGLYHRDNVISELISKLAGVASFVPSDVTPFLPHDRRRECGVLNLLNVYAQTTQYADLVV